VGSPLGHPSLELRDEGGQGAPSHGLLDRCDRAYSGGGNGRHLSPRDRVNRDPDASIELQGNLSVEVVVMVLDLGKDVMVLDL
jgi:hypothetical protein